MTESTLVETARGAHELTLNGQKVRIRNTRNGPHRFFRLTWKVGSQRFRRSFAKGEKAIAEAERIVRDLARAEGERTMVRSDQVFYYRECQKKLGNVPLHTAVEFYCKFHRVGAPRKELQEIVTEIYVDSKTRELSTRYLQWLRHMGKVWSNWTKSMALGEVTAEFVERKLARGTYSDTTKRNLLRALRTYELYAVRKKYVGVEFESVALSVRVGSPRPSTPCVLTTDELGKLFSVAEKSQVTYIAMMAFCGLRRAEFERMTAANFSLADKLCFVTAEIAKKGERRVIEIPEVALLWIALGGLPEKPTSKRLIESVTAPDRLKKVGLVWKQNALRHSFCSYHLALHRNAALTSELAGNSPQMLSRHYKALVTPLAAKEWFEVSPKQVPKFSS